MASALSWSVRRAVAAAAGRCPLARALPSHRRLSSSVIRGLSCLGASAAALSAPHRLLHRPLLTSASPPLTSSSTDFVDYNHPSPSSASPSRAADMPSVRPFELVVAATQRGGIGLKGDLPWGRQLSGDLQHFKQLTTAVRQQDDGAQQQPVNAVLMGRRTWESLPARLRPLQGRLNVVVSAQQPAGLREEAAASCDVLLASSLAEALSLLSSPPYASSVQSVFLIGGARLIREALQSCPQLRVVHLTQVLSDVECDTFMPPIPTSSFSLSSVGAVREEGGLHYQFLTYTRSPEAVCPSAVAASAPSQHEEMQYIDLVRRVLSSGHRKGDRTGTGTLSLFGAQLRFSLSSSFPLLTTKRVFWRGVVEELLWMLRGCTDSRQLAAKGVHVWDGNGSREFLDRVGLTDREEGDLGPVYGFQWRHFGAQYVSCHTDYSGQGVDQLAAVVAAIRSNPDDRRLLVSAWNPVDLPRMALPPCPVLYQLYVADGRLSCCLYQRSCDLGLGVPFNIASYSLLTVLLAAVCGLQPGELVYCLGDAHVYLNHVEPLSLQCQRSPRPFPQLRLRRALHSIDELRFEDCELLNYEPHDSIKMSMAV